MNVATQTVSLRSSLRVCKIDPHADRRWQDFVLAHPEGSVYHHPAWIKAIETEYGQPADHLACETAEGQLRGILPLLHTRGLPFYLGGAVTSRRLASLPRTPVAGPLSVDQDATIALLQEAVGLARLHGGAQLQVLGQELDGLVEGLASRGD